MAPAENVHPTGMRSKTDLLRLLGELVLRSAVLDANPASDRSSIDELTQELVNILETAIEAIGQLEQLASPTTEDEYGFLNEEADTWVGARVNAKATEPRLGDLCFAATLELSRSLRRLAQASDATDRLLAAEGARRKLHRALHAALANSGEPALREHVATTLLKRRFAAELESALVVRRMFANFRRALRRAENKSDEAVLTALRYAAGALATMTTSAHHGTIRLPDRILMSQQRDRLLDWSRAGRPAASGLQLLEDIWTCADLLRDINRRQELRTHDQELIGQLLDPASQSSADWVTRLERLSGLDDALDLLIARASEAARPEVMLDVLLRLSCLA